MRNFTLDPLVDKLRWVMLAVMLAGVGLTLAGQPSAYWSDPAAAIRGDGLGIHDSTNHSFEFFLGYGWRAYLVCSLVYIAVAFLLVSTLPRWVALVLLFTVTLTHVYAGTNWLAIRWQVGMLASSVYGLGVGVPMARLIAALAPAGQELNRRVRWIAAATLLADMSLTLLGQPNTYWSHPETAYEGNVVSRYFLVHGWVAFGSYDAVYALALLFAISALPRPAGLTVAFYFIVVSFDGASNWLFFVWREGMPAVIGYASLVSLLLVGTMQRGHHSLPLLSRWCCAGHRRSQARHPCPVFK
jgi:hypothetical protein